MAAARVGYVTLCGVFEIFVVQEESGRRWYKVADILRVFFGSSRGRDWLSIFKAERRMFSKFHLRCKPSAIKPMSVFIYDTKAIVNAVWSVYGDYFDRVVSVTCTREERFAIRSALDLSHLSVRWRGGRSKPVGSSGTVESFMFFVFLWLRFRRKDLVSEVDRSNELSVSMDLLMKEDNSNAESNAQSSEISALSKDLIEFIEYRAKGVRRVQQNNSFNFECFLASCLHNEKQRYFDVTYLQYCNRVRIELKERTCMQALIDWTVHKIMNDPKVIREGIKKNDVRYLKSRLEAARRSFASSIKWEDAVFVLHGRENWHYVHRAQPGRWMSMLYHTEKQILYRLFSECEQSQSTLADVLVEFAEMKIYDYQSIKFWSSWLNDRSTEVFPNGRKWFHVTSSISFWIDQIFGRSCVIERVDYVGFTEEDLCTFRVSSSDVVDRVAPCLHKNVCEQFLREEQREKEDRQARCAYLAKRSESVFTQESNV